MGGTFRKDRLGIRELKLDEDFLSFMGIRAFAPGDKFLGVRERQGYSRLSFHTGPQLRGK